MKTNSKRRNAVKTARILAAMMAILLAAFAASCGSKEAGSGEAGMANPWTDVSTPEEAAEGGGVGYFMLPENGTQLTGGPVDFVGYRYMKDLAEAQGYVGAAELTVRKGLKQKSEDVSGDYTEYAFSWTQETDGFRISCFGNEDGRMMKAVWLTDNFSYSAVVRGQGDISDTYGLAAEDVAALVTSIQ